MLIVGVIGINSREQTVTSLYNLFKSNGFKVNMLEIDEKGSSIKNLKQYIKILSNNNTEILIISISCYNIQEEFYKGIKFDIIAHLTNDKDNIIKENMDLVIENEKKIFNKLKSNSFAVINIDNDDYIKLLEGIRTCIITYGYNSKATITSSSIDDNSNTLSISQQRAIKTHENSVIEPQELVIKINDYNIQNIYNALVVTSVGLIFNLR